MTAGAVPGKTLARLRNDGQASSTSLSSGYVFDAALAVWGTLYLAKRSLKASVTKSCISFSGYFAWIKRNDDFASSGNQPLTITLPLRVVAFGVAVGVSTGVGLAVSPWAFSLSAACKRFGFVMLCACVIVQEFGCKFV